MKIMLACKSGCKDLRVIRAERCTKLARRDDVDAWIEILQTLHQEIPHAPGHLRRVQFETGRGFQDSYPQRLRKSPGNRLKDPPAGQGCFAGTK